MNRVLFAAFAIAAVLPVLAQDTTPPVLTGMTFSPMAVNTTTTSATVNVTMQITDNLSGVSYGFIDFISPSQEHEVSCDVGLTSGTDLNGTFQCGATLPAYSEPGQWTVAEVGVADNVGNRQTYDTSALQALGFPTTLQVTSIEDTAPPVLTGLTFSPSAVNTTTSSAAVAVTMQITDNLSGVSYGFIYFISPSQEHEVSCDVGLTSGTDLNGTFQCGATLPAYSEPGQWTVAEVGVADNVGNRQTYDTSALQALGFPTMLQVTSIEDAAPPVLTGLTFSPSAVNTTTSSAAVAVTMQITDNLSGVSYGFIDFISPSQEHEVSCDVGLTSGTDLNGTFQCGATLPAYSEPGQWTVAEVGVADNVGNRQTYDANDLQTLGFPTTLQVDPPQNPQTITFAALPHQPLSTPPFAVIATASSGLPVAFTSTTATICTVSGTTVTLRAVGACTIQATQPGNATYQAAPPVSQSFMVTRGHQAITFDALHDHRLGAQPFKLRATASSGLPVTFVSYTPGRCTVSTNIVTLLAVGNCTIHAKQPGNANWHAATQVNQTFRVRPAS